MPRLSQTVEVEVSADLLARAEQELRIYAELKKELEATKERLGALAAEAGVKSLKVEGAGSVSLVGESESWRLDRKKLLANGVLLSQIEASQAKVTRSAHTQIRLPGEKKEDE